MIKRLGGVKRFESLTCFFLPVAHGNSQQFFNPEGARVGDTMIFDQEYIPPGVSRTLKSYAAATISRLNVAGPQIQRLHEMAISINNAAHGVPSFFSSILT